MNDFLLVDEQTWLDSDEAFRNRVLYFTMKSVAQRLGRLEKWSWLKIPAMFFGSACGGAAAMVVLHVLNVAPK